jgi:HPr kinase/phosphorylase
MHQTDPRQSGEQRLHATCVAFGRLGVLLRGPSGSGKSDLALRLISQPILAPVAGAGGGSDGDPRNFRLVADDQVLVWPRGGALMARAPAILAGKLEVRGLGIIEVAAVPEIAIALVADLVEPGKIERLPAGCDVVDIAHWPFPRICLAPFEASAPAKLALALAKVGPIPYE